MPTISSRRALAFAFAAAILPAAGPVQVQRFSRPGPIEGVVARIDLRDPRVEVKLVMSDPGDGTDADCAGRLDVPSAVARRQGFAVAVNASFFDAHAREVRGHKVLFAVGACGVPVGWHFSEGRLRARPLKPLLRSTLVVHADGRITLHRALEELPADVLFAVSGDAMPLEGGRVVARSGAGPRHPRTAAGLSADGASLLLVAVDGRQACSRGVSMAELGALLKELGASDAINLDGGGSTAMVLRDEASGAYAVANHPSELALGLPDVHVERPVVDVLGVMVRERPVP